MKNIILTTESASRFFGIPNKDFSDKIFGYKWSGAVQDFNVAPFKDDDNIYVLTGVGAYLALPFLEDDQRDRYSEKSTLSSRIHKSDIVTYMLQIQKICDEGNILEAISEELVLEKDRENLLWLIDRVILTDVERYSRLTNIVKSIELPDACGACGARVGEIHRYPMCTMEECPFCNYHALQCDCVKQKLNLTDHEKYTAETNYLPLDYYENGMSDEQYDQWMDICNKKGRKPFIGYDS